MNLDRFGFKAKSNQRGNYWLYASLDFYDGIGSYGVRYHFEQGGDVAFNPAWIDPETICQCTGLKDSEGNLIYENDIIQTEYNDKIAEFVVQYLPDDFSYEITGKAGCCPLALFKCWIEHGKKVVVVGNKFDSEVEKK